MNQMLWRQQVLPGDCIHPGSLSWFIRALSGRGGWAQRNKCSFFTASKTGMLVYTGNRWHKKVQICFNSESKWQHERSKMYMPSDLESRLHVNSKSPVLGTNQLASTHIHSVTRMLLCHQRRSQSKDRTDGMEVMMG